MRDTSSSTNIQTKNSIQHDDHELCHVDYVSSNVKSSQMDAMHCIFEDNKAEIKIIIKKRSKNETCVQNPQSWLFDRINFEPKIQIKKFDKWNNLLHLCDISLFSSVCCSQNFSSASCPKTMAKRMQQRTGEEIIVAESKPTLSFEDRSKFFACAESKSIKPSGDTQSTWSARFHSSREYGETRRERLKSK